MQSDKQGKKQRYRECPCRRGFRYGTSCQTLCRYDHVEADLSRVEAVGGIYLGNILWLGKGDVNAL